MICINAARSLLKRVSWSLNSLPGGRLVLSDELLFFCKAPAAAAAAATPTEKPG